MTRWLSAVVCIMLMLAAGSAGAADRSDSGPPPRSPWTVRSPLGIDLGSTAEFVVEKRVENTKEALPFLVVKSVNGKALPSAVTIHYQMLVIDDSMVPGTTYRVKAYLDGCFTGIPAAVLREVMVQATDYHFRTRLVVYRIADRTE